MLFGKFLVSLARCTSAQWKRQGSLSICLLFVRSHWPIWKKRGGSWMPSLF